MKQAWLIGISSVLSSFCLLSAYGANNKWVYVAQDSTGYKYHFNSTTIKKIGDNITYDQMITFSAPEYGMTGNTSHFKASCKNRVAIEGNYAAIINGQSRPFKMNKEFTRMYLKEDSELGKVLTAVCQFKK